MRVAVTCIGLFRQNRPRLLVGSLSTVFPHLVCTLASQRLLSELLEFSSEPQGIANSVLAPAFAVGCLRGGTSGATEPMTLGQLGQLIFPDNDLS